MSAVLSEKASTTTDHIIDLDADPFVAGGWKVEEHRKGGAFKWNAAEVQLYLDKGQHDGGSLGGHNLRKRLTRKPVLNANALDYLLKTPQLIPEEWKGKAVFFWGTLYCYRGDSLFVRYLYWNGGRWHWLSYWLVRDFSDSDPAAVRAN